MATKLEQASASTREFTLQFLEQITDDFSEKHIIGRGGYGVVYKGRLENGEEIALKKLHPTPGLDDTQFRNEFNNLMRAQHPNITRLIGYCYNIGHQRILYKGEYVFAQVEERVLCFEYLSGGSLDKLITDESCGLDWHTRFKIIEGVCDGLNYLHNGCEHPIYHLDLKPANILLDMNLVPKIGDFGLSRLFPSEQTYITIKIMGTPGYMPPEYIERYEITSKYDVFSLGVIIVRIMAGNEGYSKCAHMSPQEFLEHVHSNWGKRMQETLSPHISKQIETCIKIALRCVEINRERRPTIAEIVEDLDKIDTAETSLTSPHEIKTCINIALRCVEVNRERRPTIAEIVEDLDKIDTAETSLTGQVAHLFNEWCLVCDHPSAGDAAYSRFVMQLQHVGLLKGDEFTERFFRILTELVVTHSLISEQIVAPGGLSQRSSHISYFPIDSYSKLVSMVLKYSSVEIGQNKGSLLPKILSVTVRVIQKDVEEKKASFNPRPYFRLFINWLNDLTTSDVHQDSANFEVLAAFANAFGALQPLRIPGLSFAWLELVSHRTFMPRLLMCNPQKGWPLFHWLLVGLFKFMEPYLRNAELVEPVHLLYKGTMRVLLVLLHDFPEFLCDYHFSFCDVIPSSCIQMRNVILSAFPRSMRLPDPSTPNLKIDLLPEISKAPRIMSEVDGVLKSKHMKADVDEYLKRPEGSSFLSDLKQKLLVPPNEANVAGTRYNVPLINSLVLYIGIQVVHQLELSKANASASAQQMIHSQMDIFQIETATDFFRNLVSNLDTEGRYLLLNAIANQLRYPNSHTLYFSFIILYLFAEATQDNIQEQITRVLLERLIVNRPHPWGLLITFTELIKNPRYNFWNRAFTHCAPEIKMLLESVAKYPCYNFWNRAFTHCAPEIKMLLESVAKSCTGKSVDDVPDGSH